MLLATRETSVPNGTIAENTGLCCLPNPMQPIGWNQFSSADEFIDLQLMRLHASDHLTIGTPAGVLPSDACCGTEGVHLLSIFPLHGAQEFARMSCIAVTEQLTPCRPPFCASRRQLMTLLLKVLPAERVQLILSDLDQKKEVQLSISDADAREVGFLAKIM